MLLDRKTKYLQLLEQRKLELEHFREIPDKPNILQGFWRYGLPQVPDSIFLHKQLSWLCKLQTNSLSKLGIWEDTKRLSLGTQPKSKVTMFALRCKRRNKEQLIWSGRHDDVSSLLQIREPHKSVVSSQPPILSHSGLVWFDTAIVEQQRIVLVVRALRVELSVCMSRVSLTCP